MMVGFTQVIEKVADSANYGNSGTLSSSVNTQTPLHDTPPNAPAGAPDWYTPRFGVTLIAGNGSQDVTTIQMRDTPRRLIPAFQNKNNLITDPNGTGGVGPIKTANLEEDFNTYISAGIYDPTDATDLTPFDNVYTILAQAPPAAGSSYSWSWKTSGNFGADFVYQATGGQTTGPAAGADWDQNVRGQVLDTSYGQGNLAAQEQTWQ